MFSTIILWLVVISLLVLQLILSVINYKDAFSLMASKNFVVTSYTNLVDVLQKYSRIYHELNIKVNANIYEPARIIDDILLVNRDFVYTHFAVPSLWTLQQLVLAESFVRKGLIKNFQKIGFLLQIIMIIGAIWEPVMLLPALLIQASLFITVAVIESKLSQVNRDTLIIATDFLDLTEGEQYKAYSILEEAKGEGFKYPLSIIFDLGEFLVPDSK